MSRLAILYFFLLWSSLATALTFTLPSQGDDIVGDVEEAQVKPHDNFSTIARRYDIGYYQLVETNPGVDPDNPPSGTVLIIPRRYILPSIAREGIVINLAELRLYYYPKDKQEVMTFPVGIGRENWATPTGAMKIMQKVAKPHWIVPASVREDSAKSGIVLPNVVPPGPDNPLGDYALRLSNPTYLVHGTNHPEAVGRRSTAGCIRLYPEDIEELFQLVHVGTPVLIIDDPYKVGWHSGNLYLEAHKPLQEQIAQWKGDQLTPALDIVKAIAEKPGQPLKIDWAKVASIAKNQMGLPQVISVQ